MEQELKTKIEEQGIKIDAIYASVEKTRKYFKMIFWITIIMIVFPVIGLLFAIPSFVGMYSSTAGGLGL